MTSATGYGDERFRNVEFGVHEKRAERWCEICTTAPCRKSLNFFSHCSGIVASFAKYARNKITLPGFFNVAAFVVVFTVIVALHTNAGEKEKPLVRFAAERDYAEWWYRGDSENHTMTFAEIQVNVGAGLRLDGKFIAPVNGLYW